MAFVKIDKQEEILPSGETVVSYTYPDTMGMGTGFLAAVHSTKHKPYYRSAVVYYDNLTKKRAQNMLDTLKEDLVRDYYDWKAKADG